jgi:hypothetical protein
VRNFKGLHLLLIDEHFSNSFPTELSSNLKLFVEVVGFSLVEFSPSQFHSHCELTIFNHSALITSRTYSFDYSLLNTLEETFFVRFKVRNLPQFSKEEKKIERNQICELNGSGTQE